MALSKPEAWKCRPILPARPKRLPLSVTVQSLSSGEMFSVEVVGGNESVYGLKTLIRARLGIDPAEQRLLVHGTVMNDAGYLGDYNVRSDSIISVVRRRRTFEVSVRNCDSGRSKVFTVRYSDNVLALKRAIFQVECIPIQKQCLTYSGLDLDDNKPLSYYSIRGSSHIELRVSQFTAGQVFVKTPRGNNLTLSVSSSTTVKSVKEMVAKREEISEEEQRLMFAGKQLAHGQTLGHYGVCPNSTLDLSLVLRGGMEITVRLQKEPQTELKLVVDLSDKILTVKEKLIEIGEVSKHCDQQLFFNGRFLDNQMTLQFYDIKPRDILDLVFSVEDYRRVIVETGPDSCIPVIMKSSDTIWRLKLKLHQLTGVPPEHQQIIIPFGHCTDSMSLRQCNIEHNSAVYQIYRHSSTMQIFVKLLQGETRTIALNAANTIWELRALISGVGGVHPYSQRLTFGGKQLEEGRTLSEYNIQQHTTIHLLLRLRGGCHVYVKTKKGFYHHIFNKSTNTIEELKSIVGKQFPTSGHILICRRKELEPSLSIEDSGMSMQIPSNNIVYLMPAVSLGSDTVIYHAHYNHTIGAIKTLIHKQTGIPAMSQCMCLDGEPLNDEVPLYRYTTDARVILELRPTPPQSSPVELDIISGTETFSITAYSPSSTIKAVKRCIQNKKGIPCESQRLILRGIELQDHFSLSRSNMESVLYLQSPLIDTSTGNCLDARDKLARSENALARERTLRLEADRRAEEARVSHEQLEQRAQQNEAELQRQLEETQEALAQECTLRLEADRRAEEARVSHEQLEQRAQRNEAELQRQLEETQEALRHLAVSNRGKTDINPWKISRRDVRMMGEIGIGAWGAVSKASYNSQIVAVKYPHQLILNEDTIRRLERETELMTQVRHPNLIRIVAAVFDEQAYQLRAPPMILTELLDLNLRQCYEQQQLQEGSKLPIFQDIAYGLHYLHDRQEPIIHRDVSAPNILLQSLPNRSWRAKVSDFGSANLARLSKTAGEGAIIYTAPEAFPQTDPTVKRVPHTVKIDVYSYGILLCEVITAKLPDPEKYLDRLEEVKKGWRSMHELIVSCTKRSPIERPTMAFVLDELTKS